jgi:hypothetical protein
MKTNWRIKKEEKQKELTVCIIANIILISLVVLIIMNYGI